MANTEIIISERLRQRFWAKVRKGPGCWEWAGNISRGYGRLRHGPRGASVLIFAHRLSWEINHGPVGDLCVCHHCDNPRCVRPEHLFLGTQADNMADAKKKGRTCSGDARRLIANPPSGEDHYNAKLTTDHVLYIRSSSETRESLALMFGVSKTTITHVRNRTTWGHVA